MQYSIFRNPENTFVTFRKQPDSRVLVSIRNIQKKGIYTLVDTCCHFSLTKIRFVTLATKIFKNNSKMILVVDVAMLHLPWLVYL